MDRLYYLTDEHFEQINRLPGTPWRDLPKAYGPWHTIDRRWQRWIEREGWRDILMLLKRLKGVDLYSHQSFCQAVRHYGFHFLFVCRPDSHSTLYEWVADFERLGQVRTVITTR